MDDRYAPATRLGLVLTIVGYAALPIVLMLISATTEQHWTRFLPVFLVLGVSFLPRLIRPGAGWARGPVRRVPAAVLLVTAVIVMVLGSTFGLGGARAFGVLASLLLLGLAVVAARLRDAHEQRPRTAR